MRIVNGQRDHLLLNYFRRCRLSGFSGWTIHTSQRMIGFAVLKITPQGRIQLGKIVDCWLDTRIRPIAGRSSVLTDRLRALSADSSHVLLPPQPVRCIAPKWLRSVAIQESVACSVADNCVTRRPAHSDPHAARCEPWRLPETGLEPAPACERTSPSSCASANSATPAE